MDFHGNLNLRNNLLRQARLETESGFPVAPQAGRILFREQDRTLYICAEIAEGLPLWVPCAQVKDMHRHAQGEAALEWTVDHNLNLNPVMLQVYDENGNWVIPNEIICNSNNRATIVFNTPVAGTAIALRGEQFGTPASGVAHEQSFTDSDEWVVVHSLGYNPDIRVYVGDHQVQPASIVHDSPTQATVTFSTPQSGFVRCA